MKHARKNSNHSSLDTLSGEALETVRGGSWLGDLWDACNDWLSGEPDDDTAIAGRTDAGVHEAATGPQDM